MYDHLLAVIGLVLSAHLCKPDISQISVCAGLVLWLKRMPIMLFYGLPIWHGHDHELAAFRIAPCTLLSP